MSIFSMHPGTRVIITQDCRPGSPATGALGVYEGDFPRTAIVVSPGGVAIEYALPEWLDMLKQLEQDGSPAPQKRAPGEPAPEGGWWAEWANPRIRLDGGDIIWGDECWWQPASDLNKAGSLDELQKGLADWVATLQTLSQALSDDAPAQTSDTPAPQGDGDIHE
jgi:hypothetical protein